jgi:hypothetical protein
MPEEVDEAAVIDDDTHCELILSEVCRPFPVVSFIVILVFGVLRP